MIPNPILKVLFSIRRHRVQALLMGGQACVFYGAAEFSRNTDFALHAAADNLDRLRAALKELDAECIAVPPFEVRRLERGHALHFRCRHPDAGGLRVDVMARMRGVESFEQLWERRTTVTAHDDQPVELLALPDLVQAKKTQRDKDWPMIRRLVEADYFTQAAEPTEAQIRFWLMELRTPELLREAVTRFERFAIPWNGLRPLLGMAHGESDEALQLALDAEMDREKVADRAYWLPLKKELEQMRSARLRD